MNRIERMQALAARMSDFLEALQALEAAGEEETPLVAVVTNMGALVSEVTQTVVNMLAEEPT